MLKYCKRDVVLNHKVYNALRHESKGFTPASVRIEHQTAKIVDQQRNAGFLLDIKKAMSLVAMFETKLFELEEEVQKDFSGYYRETDTKLIVIRSTGQVSKIAKDQNGKGVRLTDKEYLAFYYVPES